MSVHFSFWSEHLILKRFLMFALISVAAVGCQIDRTSFQMDSDRKAPILGLQLAPKQKNARTTGIRRVNVGDQDRDEKRRVLQVDRTEVAADDSKWKKLLGRFGQPKRVPLPRTDLLSNETSTVELLDPESGLQGF